MPNKITINFANTVFFIFLLLPLIGSQNIVFFTVLAKFLNTLAYLIICVVLAKTNVKFILLIGLALIFKIFYFVSGAEILQIAFWVCATLLVGSFSALYFITDPVKFYRFVNLYLLITLPIVVLQALGVFDILHSWNTLFFVCDDNLVCENTGLVVNSVGENFDNIEINPAQFRPPGLFHSQAMLSALVAFSLVLNVYSNINKLSLSLIVCIILIVFGLSKIMQVQLIMIAALITIQYGVTGLSKSLKIIFVWGGGLLLYHIIVPGLVTFQLNLEQYIFAAGSRLLDFYNYVTSADINAINANKQIVREVTNIGVHITSEEESGSLSGLFQLTWAFPILLMLLLKVKNIYSKNLYSTLNLQSILPWGMYVALLLIFVTQIMVTDTFGTQFVMYFWGLLAVPIYYSKSALLDNFRGSYQLKLSW